MFQFPWRIIELPEDLSGQRFQFPWCIIEPPEDLSGHMFQFPWRIIELPSENLNGHMFQLFLLIYMERNPGKEATATEATAKRTMKLCKNSAIRS